MRCYICGKDIEDPKDEHRLEFSHRAPHSYGKESGIAYFGHTLTLCADCRHRAEEAIERLAKEEGEA